MKQFLCAAVLALSASHAFAQAPTASARPRDTAAADGLATAAGHEVDINVGSYTYSEPDAPISIHGAKFGGQYTGTVVLNERQHWFAQADVGGLGGKVTYDGECAPWLIRPNRGSPNGYELDLGTFSPCSESGDVDWYIEGRALAGKDFLNRTWALSPYSGTGIRHLSNGTSGTAGYRTDTYLYVPFGVTVRSRVASNRALSVTVEYDRLLHGWQTTRDSELGGGFVPATPSAPAFTIDSFSDISFTQHSGWAFRASAKYQATRHWSVRPYYIRCDVGASPVNDETVAFTVNNITAREQLSAYEPFNTTNEVGVKLGFTF